MQRKAIYDIIFPERGVIMKNKLVVWVPSIVCMGIIFRLSSMTGNELQSSFPFFTDFNWGHFVAYFVLACTYYIPLYKKISTPYIFIVIVLLSILYGITDEIHQAFVPTRMPDMNDVLVDGLGASCAAFLLWIWRTYDDRRSSQ